MSEHKSNSAARELVTFEIADGYFGADVSAVHDVFALHALTPVPLARTDIAGLLNLRGRIVTIVDARRRLGLPSRPGGFKGAMAIGLEIGGESYGLLVDRVGEVLRVNEAQYEENPINLSASWRDVSRGVYRLENRLLIALDVDRMLDAAGGVQQAA
jgi:purine-binding chemotaxis protein CheW